MALTVDDYERSYYVSVLGVSALPTDSINDLRYKFYKGVYDGSIVVGGGGGVDQGTFDGSAFYGLGFPDSYMSARLDTSIIGEHNHYDYYYFKVTKTIRLRRIARDFYSITGTPSGGGTRYAIYNAISPLRVGTRFSPAAPIATFPVASGFSSQVIDLTLPSGGYFLVGHNDFSGVSAVSQRKYYAANRTLMAAEQTAFVPADSSTVAWPGSFPSPLIHTLATPGVSGLIGSVAGQPASAVLGWDAV